MLIFNKRFYYEISFYRYALILKIKQRSYYILRSNEDFARGVSPIYIYISYIGNLDCKISLHVRIFIYYYYYFFSREINFELSLSRIRVVARNGRIGTKRWPSDTIHWTRSTRVLFIPLESFPIRGNGPKRCNRLHFFPRTLVYIHISLLLSLSLARDTRLTWIEKSQGLISLSVFILFPLVRSSIRFFEIRNR